MGTEVIHKTWVSAPPFAKEWRGRLRRLASVVPAVARVKHQCVFRGVKIAPSHKETVHEDASGIARSVCFPACLLCR
jgi:hypothetical protein